MSSNEFMTGGAVCSALIEALEAISIDARSVATRPWCSCGATVGIMVATSGRSVGGLALEQKANTRLSKRWIKRQLRANLLSQNGYGLSNGLYSRVMTITAAEQTGGK
jgi:hypothetical protein